MIASTAIRSRPMIRRRQIPFIAAQYSSDDSRRYSATTASRQSCANQINSVLPSRNRVKLL